MQATKCIALSVINLAKSVNVSISLIFRLSIYALLVNKPSALVTNQLLNINGERADILL